MSDGAAAGFSEERVRARCLREKGLDLAAELGVALARRVQERRTLSGRARERALHQPIDPSPITHAASHRSPEGRWRRASIARSRRRAVPLQLPKQPELRDLPVPHHRVGGDPERFGGLLVVETTEKPQLHDPRLPFVVDRQRVERIVERVEIGTALDERRGLRRRSRSGRRRRASGTGAAVRRRRAPAASGALPSPGNARGPSSPPGGRRRAVDTPR